MFSFIRTRSVVLAWKNNKRPSANLHKILHLWYVVLIFIKPFKVTIKTIMFVLIQRSKVQNNKSGSVLTNNLRLYRLKHSMYTGIVGWRVNRRKVTISTYLNKYLISKSQSLSLHDNLLLLNWIVWDFHHQTDQGIPIF